MTHLTVRRATWLALFAVLALAGASSSHLAAQAAGGEAARRAANQSNPDRWEPTIKKFEDADKVTPPPPNGIVFIGASSIVRWNLPESFPELGQRAINRGFGGSLAADSTRYAERIVIPYKPGIVVFYAGDNDVEANHTPEQIAGDFAAFERKVHAALPSTEIIFISISRASAAGRGSSKSKARTGWSAILRRPPAPDVPGHRAADARRRRRRGKSSCSTTACT
jgi:hypothetical protein